MGERKTLAAPARRQPPQGRARGDADARFQRLIRLSTGFYWESDAAHRFTLIEHGPMYISTQAPDSQIGKTRWEIPSTKPDAAGWQAHQAALDAHFAFRDFGFARVGPDGAERQFVISGEPMFDAKGRFTGYCGIGDDVTERKRAEEALRLAEERYRTLVELSPDGIVLHEMGIIQYANASAVKLLGADSPDALLGRSLYDLVDPRFRDAARQRAIALLQQGVEAVPFVERKYLRLDGTPITVEVAGVAIRRGGKAVVQTVLRDITARKRAELLLALEHRVARRLADADNAAEALKAVIRAVCETENWEFGRYFRVDEEAGVTRFAESWCVPGKANQDFIEKSRELAYGPGVGLTGKVWQSGQALWISDIHQDTRIAPVVFTLDSGIHGAFVFPVKSEGKTIGVLAFNSREIREPDEQLLQAAGVIGIQIGQFLQHMQAEEALREAEERSRGLLMASPDAIWIHCNRRIEYVNSTLVTMLGYESAEEIVGRGIYEMLPPEQHEAVRVRLEQVETERRATPLREFVMLKRDGAALDVEAASSSFLQKGAVWIITIIRDISERKRAEQLQALEHTVNRSLADADSALGAIEAAIRTVCETTRWECGRYFRVDELADVLRFENGWCVADPDIELFIAETHGFAFPPGHGLAGKPIWASDLSRDPRVRQTARTRKAGMRSALVFPVVSKGKTIGVLVFNSRQPREPDERLMSAIRVIGSQIGQFVQRKWTEEVLRESEERFRSMTEITSDWYWEQDADFRFSRFEGLRGTGNAESLGLDYLGKQRWEIGMQIDGGWESHRALLQAHRPFRDVVTYRTLSDGSLRYSSVSGDPAFDRQGRFAGYRGVTRDITERKRGEKLVELEHAVARCLADADNAAEALKAVIRAVCETENWECGRYFRVDDEAGVLRFGEFWNVPGDAIEHFIAKSRAIVYRPGVGVTGKVWQSGQPLWVADIGTDPRAQRAFFSLESGIRGAFVFPVKSEGKTIGVLTFNSRQIREPDERLLQAVSAIGSHIGQFLQRKQAEQALRESEERFRGLSGLSSDVFWEQDDQYRFTSLTGAGSQLYEQTAQFIVGKKRWEQNYVNMTAEDWAAHIATLEARRPFRDLELCRLDENGEKVWVSVSGEPVFDPSGTFRGYRGVGKHINERKRDEERIQHLASHDALTSLPNRVLFSEVLNMAIQSAQRNNRKFAVLFIDLDRFKVINDTLGHEAGDQVLQEMGTRIKETLRTSDVVARLGGDEFVVLVQEVGEAAQVETVARKILSTLIEPMVISGQECRVSASIGICMYPADAQEEQSLMKHADAAMYHAKQSGKNGYRFFAGESAGSTTQDAGA